MQRVRDWLIGSDPGFVRLQTAARTTLTLAVALGVLYLVTSLTGAPFTVALLGVVIAMMIAMAVNEPDPRQRLISTALIPLPAAAMVTLGALLADRMVLRAVVFVAIMVAAVLVRRWGGRGTAMGMAAFMTYFFALFLGATIGQLPWLVTAIIIGAAISYLMRTFVMPERPDRVLRRTLRALSVRTGELVETTASVLRSGRFDDRARRRLRSRAGRLSETVLQVEDQLESKVDAAELWPDVTDDELAVKLFDAELAAERLVESGRRAVDQAGTMPPGAQAGLVGLLEDLRAGLRDDAQGSALAAVQDRAQRQASAPAAVPAGPSRGPGAADEPDVAARLTLAVAHLARVSTELRRLVDRAGTDGPRQRESDDEGGKSRDRPDADRSGADDEERADEKGDDPSEEDAAASHREPRLGERLSPPARQAVQVAIAAGLAIVAGELLSPARWYWAVIATFVIFTGTTSRGEVLSKGWQRVLGTAAGVPAGVLIATAVGGNVPASLVLVFVCIFFAFYLIQLAYAWMMFWITTMLAVLYGLMGQFSVGLLDLRLEETAVGAVIGVLIAGVVLPTRTRSTIRDSAQEFLTALRDVVGAAGSCLLGDRPDRGPVAQARQLHQKLQQLRDAAEPITEGIAGLRGRGTVRRFVHVMSACDHYGRTLARAAEHPGPAPVDEQLVQALRNGVERTRRNLEALEQALDDSAEPQVQPAADVLDTAEAALDSRGADAREDGAGRLRTALRSLRRIDRAVGDLASDLGGGTPGR